MSAAKPQNFHATKIFALKESKCNSTRWYLKLSERDNLLQENSIGRRKWKKLAGQEELQKFLAESYANREDSQAWNVR